MSKFQFCTLIVDDNSNDLFLIHKACEGCSETELFHYLSSGNEALAYLKGEGIYSDRRKYPFPSIIITDLKMSNGGGFDVLSTIKANPEWAVIPIIILSGSADPVDIRRSYHLGAATFFIKPDGFVELRALLKLIHAYWMASALSDVDCSEKQHRSENEEFAVESILLAPPIFEIQ